MLNHLPEDCKDFGSINQFNAFEFENTLGRIKRKIKSGYLPLEQICNHMQVINTQTKQLKNLSFERPHNLGPLPSDSYLVKTQCRLIHYHKLFLVKEGNNCFCDTSGNTFVIFNILKDSFDQFYLIVKKFIDTEDFYSYRSNAFASSYCCIKLACKLSDNFDILPLVM